MQLPWIGKVLQNSLVSQFAHTLNTTLTAGLSLVEGLTASAEVASNAAWKLGILVARNAVISGTALDQALLSVPHFPALAIQMIKIGQSSGNLILNLQQLENFFDKQVNEQLTRFTQLLEPILLLVLGVLLGILIIALYWPLFELGNAF